MPDKKTGTATSNEEAKPKTKTKKVTKPVTETPKPPKNGEITKDVPTEIEVIKPAEIIDNQIIFTQNHLELIKNQIAPNSSPEEFDLFIMMSRRMRSGIFFSINISKHLFPLSTHIT